MEMLNFLSFYKVPYTRTVRPYIANQKLQKLQNPILHVLGSIHLTMKAILYG